MTAWSRLHAATLELVKGSSIKQRLAVAYSSYLREVDPGELPSEIRSEFLDLIAELERVKPLPGETAVQATVRKMSADQADACAGRIVQIYGDLARSSAPPVSVVTRIPMRDKRDDAAPLPLLYAAEA